MSRRFAAILLLVSASLVLHYFGGTVEAGTTGKIAGRVVDTDTNQPLPGVNVVIEGTMMGAATDADGYYFVINVPPGVYTVKASMIGYQEVRYENVRVSIDMTTTLNFRLKETVLDLGEAVTVVAERPLVRKDLTSTEAVVNSQTIQRLPVDRFHDVVNLQAGVVEGHFRGGRQGEVMYMIDGVPVNDIYSGQPAFEVENNAIAELQVISGTFNAEHGQAMSGVVNIVTREGGDRYAGSLSAYLGDYLSWGKQQKEIFWNIDRLNPSYNLQGTLSGPLPFTAGTMNFFLSGRYYDSEGYIYGKDVCGPSDQSDFTADAESKWTIMSHGKTYSFSEEVAQRLIREAKAVPMNPERRATAQGKLSVRLSTADKLSIETLLQDSYFKYYDHRFRLNPSGDYKRYQRGYNTSLAWNRVLSPRAFFSLKGTYFYTVYKQFVLEDPFDPGYVSSRRLQDTGANAFLTGGMQMWNFHRSTGTIVGKFDLTYQATQRQQFKTGLEVKRHRLWMHEFEVVPELPERVPPRTSFNNNQYTHRPVEFAAYVQDKMEFDYMIVNAGVRFDHFEPDGEVPTNFREPSSSPRVRAEGASQLSPRLGIAYPITERGVIHVSYGHFFQIPNLDFMYTNPEFDIYPLQSTPSPPPHSLLNTVGNTTLKPQKTVIYEMGLQQQLTEDLALDVTAYYKDIRNLLGTEVLMTLQGIRYGRYINRDYGNVKGVTVAFEKRHKGGVGATLDYTFQIAKGNASDPNTAFLDQQTEPPRETTKQMVPLNWDRRHQVNATLTLGSDDDVSVNLIGRFGTGLPYTPSFQNIQTAVENSGRKPLQYNVDLYAYKTFRLGKLALQLFLRVYNLFDRLNEVEVFTDTGRAGYSLAPVYSGGLRPRGVNTLEQYYVRPDFYSAPRQVQCGVTLEF
ncbi:MAG: TonB-dependent receptor [bacterium]|jgi:outer membrane receptor for ferrienterochelin and colicin|nr:TonB-dependent receptor [candidate division KSB1 bacterium]MDH7559536.1 TonB-dependent receptor [bacterium]